jgi:hypothetical protein
LATVGKERASNIAKTEMNLTPVFILFHPVLPYSRHPVCQPAPDGCIWY